MNGSVPLPTTPGQRPSHFSMALTCASILRKRMNSGGDFLLLQPQQVRFCPGFGDLLLGLDPDPIEIPPGFEGELFGRLFFFDHPVEFFREFEIDDAEVVHDRSVNA
jgi:hypothetical protein